MGNTLVQYWCNEVYKDHPHIHGEYLSIFLSFLSVIGSPPHTWGIRRRWILMSTIIRITPTYMGNTLAKVSENHDRQDHPHIHGEYESRNTHRNIVVGSPPHTWGIRLPRYAGKPQYRITPTYMGNTVMKTVISFTM